MTKAHTLLVVSARSGCGKTTLIERLIPALAALGVRTAVVKLTHHDVDPDPPGKDSRRLRDAGAECAVLAGSSVTSLFLPRTMPVPELADLAAMATGAGLVLVEGGRDVPDLPRIEVLGSDGPLHTQDTSSLLAVVADDGAARAPHGVPTHARDDITALAARIATWLRADE